jgi:very-short-patch-repair endonuclease
MRAVRGSRGGRLVLSHLPGAKDLFARQHGLARRDQLRALGIDADHVAHQVAAGRWQLVAPEVVSCDNGRLDEQQLLWRSILNTTGGWIGGRSALRQSGLTGHPPTHIHVLVRRDHVPPRLQGVVVQVTGRPPEAAATRVDDLPITSPARSAVDGAAWERWPRSAAGLVLAVVQQRLATPGEILAELHEAGRVRHRAIVRDAMQAAAEGAESLAEADVAPLLTRAGLGAPQRQVRIGQHRHDLAVRLADGRLLVVEVDGPTHDSPEGRWSDAERDASVAAAGALLVRIPAYAVRHDPAEVVARLRTIGDAARARARARGE